MSLAELTKNWGVTRTQAAGIEAELAADPRLGRVVERVERRRPGRRSNRSGHGLRVRLTVEKNGERWEVWTRRSWDVWKARRLAELPV